MCIRDSNHIACKDLIIAVAANLDRESQASVQSRRRGGIPPCRANMTSTYSTDYCDEHGEVECGNEPNDLDQMWGIDHDTDYLRANETRRRGSQRPEGGPRTSGFWVSLDAGTWNSSPSGKET